MFIAAYTFFVWLIFLIINFVSEFSEIILSLASVSPNYYIESSNIILLFSSTVPIKVYLNADLDKERIILENKNRAGVYQFINLSTGESYVGSSIKLSNRLRQYYTYSYISSPARGRSMIFSSILKNGYSNFSLIILEYCEIKDTISREQFYIDVIQPTMNILQVAGNSLGYRHSKEDIEKIRNIKRISCKGSNNGFYGKSHTPENIKLLSEIAKARTKLPYAKPVILTDSNHKIIQKFDSMSALSLYLKADRANLAQHRKLGKLFRNYYYIKDINNE